MNLSRALSREGFVLAIIIGLLLAGCSSGSQPAASTASNQASGKWSIPVLVPATGFGASYSVDYNTGLDLALKEINGAGGIGGKQVELSRMDTQSDIAQAVSLAQQACEKGALIIIGPLLSTEAESVFPVVNRAKCPILAPSPAKPGLTAPNRPWTFVLATPASNLAPSAVQRFVKTTKAKTAVVVVDKSDPSASDQGKLSADALEANGVKVLTTINTSKQDVDFSPVVTRIGGAAPDVIVVASMDTVAIGMLEELHKQNLAQIPLMITQSAYTPAFARLSANLLEGVHAYSDFWADNPDKRLQSFVAQFKAARNGETPTQVAAQTYDTLNIVRHIFEKANVTGNPGKLETERGAVRDGIVGLADWPGVTGNITFSDQGYPNKGVYLLKWRQGKPDLVPSN